MKKTALLALLLLTGIFCSAPRVQAQNIAVKTNILYWATGTLNAGVELKASKHSTINVTCNLNPWTYGDDAKIQHWFVRPEYRYWVTEAHTRLFFGIHAMGGDYKIGGFKIPYIGNRINRLKNFQHNYCKGSFIAGGVGMGYAFYLSPHLNLEVSGGVGIAYVKYHAEPCEQFPKGDSRRWRGRNKSQYLPMPTELSVSLVYLFNGKK